MTIGTFGSAALTRMSGFTIGGEGGGDIMGGWGGGDTMGGVGRGTDTRHETIYIYIFSRKIHLRS